MTSPGPGSGAGTSCSPRTSGPPYPSSTTARTPLSCPPDRPGDPSGEADQSASPQEVPPGNVLVDPWFGRQAQNPLTQNVALHLIGPTPD